METEALQENQQEKMQSDQPQLDQQESGLLSADANPKGDGANRSKRFIWFSWGYPIIHPYAYVLG